MNHLALFKLIVSFFGCWIFFCYCFCCCCCLCCCFCSSSSLPFSLPSSFHSASVFVFASASFSYQPFRYFLMSLLLQELPPLLQQYSLLLLERQPLSFQPYPLCQ